jgi:hypothetical protein
VLSADYLRVKSVLTVNRKSPYEWKIRSIELSTQWRNYRNIKQRKGSIAFVQI